MGRFEITLKEKDTKKEIKAEVFIAKRGQLVIGRTFGNKTGKRKGTLIGRFQDGLLLISTSQKGLEYVTAKFRIPNKSIFNQMERQGIQEVKCNSLKAKFKIKKSTQSAKNDETSFEELKEELLRNYMAEADEERINELMALGKL